MEESLGPASKQAGVVCVYQKVKNQVIRLGFGHEIQWQGSVDFKEVTETDFLREYAWVVLTCGMKEKVISHIFPSFSDAFYEWESSWEIVRNEEKCRGLGLEVFHNQAKVEAIITTAKKISVSGFEYFKKWIERDTLTNLRSLPYIGMITQFHLAKNLGMEVAKPDRHLSRIAHLLGYNDVQALCKKVSNETGDRISVVDLVFWRFASISNAYLDLISEYVNEVVQE
ncbi:MAG: HhH-GDP family DNA glycosylase [Thermoplasmataceae archaeon]